MTTVKVKFRKSSLQNKPGSLYYQLCHGGKVKVLAANMRLGAEYWDSERGQLVELSPKYSEQDPLSECRFRIESDLVRFEQIISHFDRRGSAYSLEDVADMFRDSTNDTSLVLFFRELIEHCRSNKKLGTARNYERTLRSFQTFLNGGDIPFSMLTGSLVFAYEKYLIERGVKRNSSSFYIRNLRAVYNKAVKRGFVVQRFPFNEVYTGIDRTPKRAVEEDVIVRLLKMELNHSKPLALARDLFVFSYCTRGMSFVDISFLRKTDVLGGIIRYVRRKTKQQLSVRIEPCIERIIRQYENETKNSPYVFPIITSADPETAYKQYQIALNYHNRKLKRIGKEIGQELSLSSYTARHTWATTARKHNVPLSIISEGMGHTSEKTTRIYLAALDNSVIDEANRVIIRRLNAAG